LLVAGREDGMQRARLLLAGGGELHRPGVPQGPAFLRELAARARERAGGFAGHAWWCLPAGAVLGLLGESWLPLLAGACAVPLVLRWLRRSVGVREAERREGAVVELCGAVAGELRAGRPPEQALLAAGASAVRELGEAGSAVLAAARFGGDVPDALRRAARFPGAGGLRWVAACWQVAVEDGAGLAEGLERIAGALRAERGQREDLAAQLAGSRATAAVLALLPLFGLLMGSAMGADPLGVLLHSPAGAVCLVVGGLLEWAGLAWVAFLVRAAEGESA
jgi:tight adherence protein B